MNLPSVKPAKRVHLSDVHKTPGLSAEVDALGFGIKLKLKNDSDQTYRVAVTGGVLQPSDSGYQRLLVVGTTQKVDHVFLPAMNQGHCVIVPPHGEAEAELQTCCMDRPKAPPSGNAYHVGKNPAPERLAKIARAAATKIAMGDGAPFNVSISDVQSAAWDQDCGEQRNRLDNAVNSGKF